MISILNFINTTIGSREFLFIAEFASLSCKLYLFMVLIMLRLRNQLRNRPLLLLIIFLSGAILNDIEYVIVIGRRILKFETESHFAILLGRIVWAFFITQHQALSLFLEYLVDKKVKFKFHHIAIFIFSACIALCFLYIAFFASQNNETYAYELRLVQTAFLFLIPLFTPILYKLITNIYYKKLPTILTHQLRIVTGLVILYLFIELITNKNSMFYFITELIPLERRALLSLSTMISAYSIYYCCKRMMGLRFLNFTNHVEAPAKFNFINDFKDILEQLTYVTSVKELAHITQTFFKAAFQIPVGRARFYARKNPTENINNEIYPDLLEATNKVEHIITCEDGPNVHIKHILKQSKILIKDEIEFTNFYDTSLDRTAILDFLDGINADIFLPIYERQTIIGYIIIEKDARPNNLFSDVERDEMLVFASYLSNIINILKHGNLDALLQKEKNLHEELFHKHQEINQYKESMRSFLRSTKDRKIGILFYKARRFTHANQAAQELFNFDINTNEGHPLTQALKQVARKVQEYKASQTIFARDSQGSKVVIAGIPSIESQSVIIMAYYPEVSDILKSQFDLLKDPSTWDYLLYLETTQSGQLINQLIPGTSETLLNFKINLLTTALSKKATLLHMHEDDVLPTVEILHHISLRQTLHTLKLNAPEKNDEVALKLFGMNPLFGLTQDKALLEKLDNIGTLFIQNIDFLSLQSQHYLADFILYGYYHPLRSDHKLFSNVRIICSTTKNLQALVTDGQFSKALFQELKKTTLIMPSLITLPEEEIVELAHGFTEQALKTQTFKNLLNLSDKDKDKLLDQRAISLQELKAKVHQFLVHKSTKHHIHDKTEFDPAYHTSDPELTLAVRLGKKALKDPQMLAFLWQKFKNQNKIATLLGVNRSSVNRRCREYKLY
jgi:transcriptional regulator of aromatic amino acid metabolism